MMKYVKMIKKGDVLIVLLLIIGSFLPLGLFTYQQAMANQTDLKAVVKVDGETMYVFDLVDDGQTETYRYHDEDGHENIIVRTGNSVTIVEANCSDQVCVRMGDISKVGETNLCLPHKLLVEIQSDQPLETPNEIDVIS